MFNVERLAGRPLLRRALFAAVALAAITEHLTLLVYVIAPERGSTGVAVTTAVSVLIVFGWTAVHHKPAFAVGATIVPAVGAFLAWYATSSLAAAMFAAGFAPAVATATREVAGDPAPDASRQERIGIVTLGLALIGAIVYGSPSVAQLVMLAVTASLFSIGLASTYTATADPAPSGRTERWWQQLESWGRQLGAWWRDGLSEPGMRCALAFVTAGAVPGAMVLSGAAAVTPWTSLRPALVVAAIAAVIAFVVRGTRAFSARADALIVASVIWLAVGSATTPIYVVATVFMAAWLLAIALAHLPAGRDIQPLLMTAIAIGLGVGVLAAQTPWFHEIGELMTRTP